MNVMVTHHKWRRNTMNDWGTGRHGSAYASEQFGKSCRCARYSHKTCKRKTIMKRTGKLCNCECHD